MASGCGVELPGLEPPTDTLYYPSSTTDLGNGELLIVNGNFDLKFKTAWLNVVDLSEALESGQDEAPDRELLDRGKPSHPLTSGTGLALSTMAISFFHTVGRITEVKLCVLNQRERRPDHLWQCQWRDLEAR